MGEVGEPLKDEKTFPIWPPELYVDWHNGERISVNELTGIDRDLVLMGVPVADLEFSKDCVNTLAKTGISYQGALKMFHFIKFPRMNSQDAQRVLNNLGRLP